MQRQGGSNLNLVNLPTQIIFHIVLSSSSNISLEEMSSVNLRDKRFVFADLLPKDDTSSAVRGSLIEISSGGGFPCQSVAEMLKSNQFEQIFVCSPK